MLVRGRTERTDADTRTAAAARGRFISFLIYSEPLSRPTATDKLGAVISSLESALTDMTSCYGKIRLGLQNRTLSHAAS